MAVKKYIKQFMVMAVKKYIKTVQRSTPELEHDANNETKYPRNTQAYSQYKDIRRDIVSLKTYAGI